MEIGKINAIQKIACPHCGNYIENLRAESITPEGYLKCETCSGKIKLPETVIQKIAQKAYLGRNIDISC